MINNASRGWQKDFWRARRHAKTSPKPSCSQSSTVTNGKPKNMTKRIPHLSSSSSYFIVYDRDTLLTVKPLTREQTMWSSRSSFGITAVFFITIHGFLFLTQQVNLRQLAVPHAPQLFNSSTTTTTTTTRTTDSFTVSEELESSHNTTSLLYRPDLLPDWFLEYLSWHTEQKALLTTENWQDHRFVVLRCMRSEVFCSGTCDRMRNYLFLMYLAHKSNRIFLIHWGRPAPMESFLVPPEHGLDWRAPDWLLPKLELGKNTWEGMTEPEFDEEHLLDRIQNKTSEVAVEFNFIWLLSKWVDEKPHEYAPCFRNVFSPSPPVQRLIDSTKQELGLLTPYIALHLRTKYVSKQDNLKYVEQALLCTSSRVDERMPIFVASDSIQAVQLALKVARAHNMSHRVVARTDLRAHPPLHLDRGSDYLNPRTTQWKNHNVSEYYSVFVDLFLLGGASCVATGGVGNYGHWGRLLSQNVSCAIDYNNKAKCPQPNASAVQ